MAVMGHQQILRRRMPMRYRLRTLLILLAIVPPLLAYIVGTILNILYVGF